MTGFDVCPTLPTRVTCAFRHLGRQSAWGATRNATCHDALCLCQCHGQSFQCHTTWCNLAQIWHLGRNGIGKWREVLCILFWRSHTRMFFFGGGKERWAQKKTATCFFSWRWKKWGKNMAMKFEPQKCPAIRTTLHPQLLRLDAWQHLVCLRRACCTVAGNFAKWKGCGAMAMIGHGMPYYGMLWHVGNSQNCPPFVYLPHIHCLIWLHIDSRWCGIEILIDSRSSVGSFFLSSTQTWTATAAKQT